MNGAEVNPPLTFALKLDPAHPYLKERGVAEESIATFGLGYCSRGMMRGRVCIPIHNEHGELVAYAGRWAGREEDIPAGKDRYELPPRFEKSRILFNLHRVDDPLHLILVEGFFGAIRPHALGLPVVSLMGRSLSEHHIALLARAGVRYVTLLLDGDKPGWEASGTIMGQLAKSSLLVRAVMLPDGTEPDTLPAKELVERLDSDGSWPALS